MIGDQTFTETLPRLFRDQILQFTIRKCRTPHVPTCWSWRYAKPCSTCSQRAAHSSSQHQLLEVAQKIITMILGAQNIKKEGILHGCLACFRIFRWSLGLQTFSSHSSLLLESAKLINLVFESSCHRTELRQVQMTHCEVGRYLDYYEVASQRCCQPVPIARTCSGT